jgi:hypothetical protein
MIMAFSKILVRSFAPGSLQEVVECTSESDFLVYGITNGGGDYAINVKSTGAGLGVGSPTFTVGGIADDIVTIIIQPGTTGFLTLQTEKGAEASFSG